MQLTDIRVVTFGDSPEQAVYKIGNQRNTKDFNQLASELIGDRLADLANVAEVIRGVWSEASVQAQRATSSEEGEDAGALAIVEMYNLYKVCPPRSRALTENATALLKDYLAWSTDKNGVVIWYYRTESAGRVWNTCDTPISAMTQNGGPIFKEFNRKWTALSSKHLDKGWLLFDSEEEQFSPKVFKDHEFLAIAVSLYKKEFAREPSQAAKDLFVLWLSRDLNPKFAPKPPDVGVAVSYTYIESLYAIFHISSPSAWGTRMMLEDMSTSIPAPVTITNSPDVDAFSYVNLTALRDGPTPAWDAWLECIHPICRSIFMAAVYAPMVAECSHRKVVWMRSQGYDGKSTFFKALNRWSQGKLTASFGGHNLSSDFGLESIVGARILIWGDSQHENALSTNVVHSITGGDPMTVNRKNQKAISHEFNSMLFVASNGKPQLKTWQRNEVTRLLYVPFIEPPEHVLATFAKTDADGKVMRQADGTPMYTGSNLGDRFVAEMDSIMYKCQKEYEKHSQTNYDLVIPHDVYNLMMEENEHDEGTEFDSFFDKNLVLEEGATCEYKDVNDLLRKKIPGCSKFTFKEFSRYVEQRHKVEQKKIGPEHRRRAGYVGMRLKIDTDTDETTPWS